MAPPTALLSSLFALLAILLLALPIAALPAPEPQPTATVTQFQYVHYQNQYIMTPKSPLTTTLHIPGPGPTRTVYAGGRVDQGVQRYVPCYGYAGLQVVTDVGAEPVTTTTVGGVETKTRYVCEPGATNGGH